jgi:hypothetical protein
MEISIIMFSKSKMCYFLLMLLHYEKLLYQMPIQRMA